MKEDGDPELQRQQSADEGGDDEYAMMQRGTAISEARDRDDDEEGANVVDEGNGQGIRRYR